MANVKTEFCTEFYTLFWKGENEESKVPGDYIAGRFGNFTVIHNTLYDAIEIAFDNFNKSEELIEIIVDKFKSLPVETFLYLLCDEESFKADKLKPFIDKYFNPMIYKATFYSSKSTINCITFDMKEIV